MYRDVIQRLACPGPALVLAPLGVGGHVDHVLVRTAAERSGAQVGYYSDFPYNQRHPAVPAFVQRNGLVEARWSRLIEAKAELIRAYRTQARALFGGGGIPVVPEVFFIPDDPGNPAEREQVTTTRISHGPAAASSARPRAGTVCHRCRGRWRRDPAHPAGAAWPLVRPVRRRGHIHRSRPQCHLRRVPPVRRGAFFLHGPGFFYLEAGWARLVGNQPGLMAWIYEMRTLNALLAAATAVVLVLLAARVSSLRAGTVAGLLFALDPFCIRQNDRVLLETAMMFWVMLGYLVFTSLSERPPSRRDWPRAVGAGLLFGCAVLTKDEGALLTVLPLLAAAVLRWGPRRSLTLLTAGTTVAVYAAYVAVVVANGQFSGLWDGQDIGPPADAGATPDHRLPQFRRGEPPYPPHRGGRLLRDDVRRSWRWRCRRWW